MRNKILLAAALPICMVATSNGKEPSVMTVNGVEVPRSEFQYLYQKNNQQQIEPQTLDEYVEMFKVYKLKVADARSLGIDTTENFKKEIAQYRRELAAPYIADSLFISQMIDDAFRHSGEEVEVSFIKIGKSRNPAENENASALADSLAGVLKSGANFAEAARQYSQEVASERGGYHGYMTFGRLPYSFETALYSLAPDEISDVVELADGYYILKGGQRRPSRGKIEGAHILRLVPPSASPEEKMRRKAEIDSVYAILKDNPERFGEIAKQFSDDKATGRSEGKLPVFTSGEMVPELETVAFSIGEGEISEPFETRYGWHIMKKSRHLPSPSQAQVKEYVLQRISNPQDERFRIVKDHEMNRLVQKYKGKLDKKALEKMKKEAVVMGIDSMYLANWTTMPVGSTVVGKIGHKEIKASDVASTFKGSRTVPAELAPSVLERAAERAMQQIALDLEEEELYQTVAEYRNLVDEYTDGSLLYEVSLLKVWDKGSKDTEGMENYFKAHSGDFKWNKRHAKGILVQSINDSIGGLIRTRLDACENPRECVENLKKDFNGKASIDIVVVEEGANPLVDYLIFGGAPAKPKMVAYNDFYLYNGRIIDSPEEASDARGEVAAAYQNALEQEWIESLRDRFPVSVNFEEIEKLR